MTVSNSIYLQQEPAYRRQKETLYVCFCTFFKHTQSSGIAMAIDIKMNSSIKELKSTTHKIDMDINGERGAVTLKDLQPQGHTRPLSILI